MNESFIEKCQDLFRNFNFYRETSSFIKKHQVLSGINKFYQETSSFIENRQVFKNLSPGGAIFLYFNLTKVQF